MNALRTISWSVAIAVGLVGSACSGSAGEPDPSRPGGTAPVGPAGECRGPYCDSDNDGLTDDRERMVGTDPMAIDTDGDGVTDFGEVDGTGTDPLDPTSTIPEGDFFLVLPYQDPAQERMLRFGTNIDLADVFFLLDMTASMRDERQNLIAGLIDTIIPGIQASIRDVEFGVGGLDDYPFDDPTASEGGYGGGDDLPFYLLRPIGPAGEDLGSWSHAVDLDCPPAGPVGQLVEGTADGVPDLLEAVRALPCHGGRDTPESYVPALYATATGEGLAWPTGSIPAQSCPRRADEFGDRRGYPCFRPGALPIVLLFGDNDWHNGPGSREPYSFPAPSYVETTSAMNELGGRVVSVWSQGSGLDAFEAMARDTGTVDGAGVPLVFTINEDGTGLSNAVVDAVASLVGGTPQDVSTRTVNEPGNPDDVDATQFIQSIVPLEGYRDALPDQGYDSKDSTTFYGVIPGTQVDFAITFQNDFRVPAASAEIFKARIIVLGNRVANLDSRNVYVIVPGDGSTVLI